MLGSFGKKVLNLTLTSVVFELEINEEGTKTVTGFNFNKCCI